MKIDLTNDRGLIDFFFFSLFFLGVMWRERRRVICDYLILEQVFELKTLIGAKESNKQKLEMYMF